MRFIFTFVCFQALCVFAVITCKAQSYYFKHYQADDGLAHNSVNSIIQDKKGLIWIGTRGGLNRFDGYTFKNFRNEKSKFGNIGNNVIICISEDQKGMLWIGTGKGIFKYDPYKEIFTALDIAPQDYTSHVLVDHQNNIFFLAGKKLYKYIQRDKKLQNFRIMGSCIALDRNKNLWIGDDEGILRAYNSENELIKTIRIIEQSIPINLRSISKIFPAQGDEILIGCFKQGLKSYNLKTGLIRSLPLLNSDVKDIYVRDITAGNKQEYWVATESGIYIYNLATNTSRNLRKRAGDPYSIADNAIYTVCRDSEGGMWAGTFFGGLNYYSKENARFEKYYPLVGTNSISGSAVREISGDNKGNLWIGTEDAGFNKFNIKTGKFTNFSSIAEKGDVSYPNIHGLLALDNQLFVGPFLHGMEIMDIHTGLVTDRFKLIGDKNDKISDFVLCIYLTKDSTLLIGTAYKGSGLFTFDRKQKTFSRVKQIPYNSYVFDIKEDKEGNVWTGSVAQGAFFYNPKTGKHGNIRFGDKVKNNYINEFPVYGILEDSSNAIWFATEGGGMIRLSPDRKVLKKFTTESGLPTNVLFRMLEDDSKHLWISSLKGLICFDMRTEKFKIYTQSNGLITDQFNFNSAYKDATGKMYFGSVKGMIAFNPKDFERKEKGPSTYITGFQVNNEEVVPNVRNSPLTKSILYTDTVVLEHNQNNFSIEFAALNYSSAEVTRYEYLMKGLDKTRTYLNSNRQAYFTDLSAGRYTFIVRAKSNVGSWIGKERHIFIKILPPFWESHTAYLLYLLMLTGTLFLTVRYYHRYLERKNLNKQQLFEHEKEKEIYTAKIEFFTNIAHEIQTPLTLILGPVERMIKKADEHLGIKKSLYMVEKNAKRLAELTSQLLDFRKTEMHQFGLNFVNTDITWLLKEQIASFRQEAEKNKISLKLEIPKNHVVVFADREALVKICSNLISNAIKYAETFAVVSLSEIQVTDEQFIVRFSNDGEGIPDEFKDKIFEPFFRLYSKDKPGTGIGLSLARSLTELHNGSLKLTSSGVDLVAFELSLPIHQKFEFNLSSWKKIK
ncbi:ligand-binding sensor domain-containing protein [Pedobacter mucosus]|uniref:ligand-binding sensor domain-containing protein n=1 Tax=Pedobacter mucosus TaxID=2895286 RepID=UPI001EE4A9D4|nr:two-component regulator propeller domain-containing protein [Pedobacter mucosus]UKT65942.1 histidine kinase [Pedobacter mucosus]